MRPLGAVLFGYIGDRVGRGPALLWSVVAMAVPTFVMGLLPTYAEIGIGVFPRHVRCSAVSAAYNLTLGIAGGTAPAVATWLIGRTGSASVPALYIMVAGAISAIAALSVHARSRQAIADSVMPHLATAEISGG
jgi:MHS family proline/betaine transporter-like MFS transporter